MHFKVSGGYMNQTENKFEQLTKALKEFGLQPADWMLISASENRLRIQNKSEPDFCFMGLYLETKGVFQWNHIRLMSL